MRLIETRWRHPLDANPATGEELFLETCDSRGVGGVAILVNTNLVMSIDSFEQLTTRIERLRLSYGSMPSLTIFVAFALTSSYDEDHVEAFYYMGVENFCKEDRTFYKVTFGYFNCTRVNA